MRFPIPLLLLWEVVGTPRRRKLVGGLGREMVREGGLIDVWMR